MQKRFDPAFRRMLIDGLQGFERYQPVRDPAVVLKRAAVCITLTDADAGAGADAEKQAAFVLTRRARGLRNHGGQWALPGGRLDAGETAQQAALRELEEETGWRPERVEIVGDFASSPGMVSETFTLVTAHGLTKVGDGGGVPGEDITVHRIALGDVPSFAAAKRAEGVAIDVKLLLLLAPYLKLSA
jgi:8-oxo-dGTP pyrophosphatase MutT (NUDIX family)